MWYCAQLLVYVCVFYLYRSLKDMCSCAGKQLWTFSLNSGYYRRRTRWNVVRDAVDKFLGTLDVNDNINVITYNRDPQILSGEVLIQATDSNIDLLEHDLDNTSLGNGSDPARAFDAAFDLFETSFNKTILKFVDHPVYPKCRNVSSAL